MNIESFVKKYGTTRRPISDIINDWVTEKKVEDFLGMPYIGGVTVADMLVGDGLTDTIPPEVLEAFKGIMGEKADTYQEVKAIIVDKVQKGEASIEGLKNTIQGRLGELEFIDKVGDKARLASLPNQEGWDIAIDKDEVTRYVQVKVYNDADRALDKLKELQEKIADGKIQDGEKVIDSVDFAVNSDIYEEVKEKATALGLDTKILDIGVTHEKLRDIMNSTQAAVAGDAWEQLKPFAEELFGDMIEAAFLPAVISAFLAWKKNNDADFIMEEAFTTTIIYTGSIAASSLAYTLTNKIIEFANILADIEEATSILNASAGVVGVATSITARAVLRRIANSRFFARRMMEENRKLEVLCASLST